MKETMKGKGTQLARKTEIVRDRDLVEWTETGKAAEEPEEHRQRICSHTTPNTAILPGLRG